MQPLEPPDLHHLHAAQGWIELGNYIEAIGEFENISPMLRVHPDVLEIRWQMFARVKKWDDCVDTATALVKIAPERADSWIHRSFSLHELKRTQEALENLLPVAEKFPGIWTIPYNLACYCAQLGRFPEAKDWFKMAVLIDDDAVHRLGADDPDLKPLWESMSTPI